MGSIDEAFAGIACEEQRLVTPLKRSLHKGEEFIERIQKTWDVKISLSGEYIFEANKFLKSVKTALLKDLQENIIINASYLSESEMNTLIETIQNQLTKKELGRIILVHGKNATYGKKYLNLLREF